MNWSCNPDVYAEGELVMRAAAEDSSVVQHPKWTLFSSNELNEEVVCAITHIPLSTALSLGKFRLNPSITTTWMPSYQESQLKTIFLMSGKWSSSAQARSVCLRITNLRSKSNTKITGTKMNRMSVKSSNLASVGYENGVLEIKFLSGRVYQYDGVPEDIHSGLMNASSKGRYFWRYARTDVRYRQKLPDRRGVEIVMGAR